MYVIQKNAWSISIPSFINIGLLVKAKRLGLKQTTPSVSQNFSNPQYLWSSEQDQNILYNYKFPVEPKKDSAIANLDNQQQQGSTRMEDSGLKRNKTIQLHINKRLNKIRSRYKIAMFLKIYPKTLDTSRRIEELHAEFYIFLHYTHYDKLVM